MQKAGPTPGDETDHLPSMTRMRHRFRTFFFNLALVLASLLVTGLLVEVALRVYGFSYVSFHRPDARLGLRLREHAEGVFNTEGHALVRINGAGFRDREHTVEKPAGTFRIAVLGDSYIEALQVDLDKTFPALLEQHLNACDAFDGKKVEVLNFGVSSYGTAQELLTFRHFAAKFAPDLVIASVFTGNDIRNNSRELEPDKLRPFFVLDGGALVEDGTFAESAEFKRRTNRLRTVLDGLRVLRVVQAGYFVKDLAQSPAPRQPAPRAGAGMFESGLDNIVFAAPAAPAWRDAWALTERLLARLNEEVRASGARLEVLTLSSGVQVHPDPSVRREFLTSIGTGDAFFPDRQIESMASHLNIESIILAPEMQKMAERDNTFFHGFPNTRMGTGHWNEAGHRAAADIVGARLCKRAPAAAS